MIHRRTIARWARALPFALVLLLAGCGCNKSSHGSSSEEPEPKASGAESSEPESTGAEPSEPERPRRAAGLPAPVEARDGLVHEGRSEYSHFKVIDRGSTRYLMFVRDSGQQVVESAIDLRHPDRLVIDYTRVMFASHLFRPEQQRILLVGLGGGAMVRFLRRYFPDVDITAVDIDPKIVEVAKKYFGIEPAPDLELVVQDGFEFLRGFGERYDVIYMDAFLKPSEATDQEGTPLRLKTLEFLQDCKDRLVEDGLFVVNINVQPDTPEDVATLKEAFANVYQFRGGGNLVVVGSTDEERVSEEAMLERARKLDARASYGFEFEDLVGRLKE